MRSSYSVGKSHLNVVVAAGLWLMGAVVITAGGSQPANAAGLFSAMKVAVAPQPVSLPSAQADPGVVARIDLSDQTMSIYVGNRLRHTFTVSTGRGSYRTPTGTWKAQWLSPNHRSSKYNNAPMPWSVFFYRGYAVHGTTDIARLGQPASHGCVRLHPNDAKVFFDLVKVNGKSNTTISVVN